MQDDGQFEKIREKICKDFYPNCRYCTCFSACFPQDIYQDVRLEAAVHT